MKLQLALDCESISAALALLEKTADLIDIAEVGTPLVLREGAAAVAALKSAYPALAILADFKIMDAGEMEALIAFEAGADIVTVLAAAETVTVSRACEAARKAGREVMVDLMAVTEPERRAAQLIASGADYLCCHAAFDTQSSGAGPAGQLSQLRAALPRARLAVAGGVSPERAEALLPFAPEIVIVGGYVTRAKDPRQAALEIRAALR